MEGIKSENERLEGVKKFWYTHGKLSNEDISWLIMKVESNLITERDPIKDIEKWARICLEVEREKKVYELMEGLKGK